MSLNVQRTSSGEPEWKYFVPLLSFGAIKTFILNRKKFFRRLWVKLKRFLKWQYKGFDLESCKVTLTSLPNVGKTSKTKLSFWFFAGFLFITVERRSVGLGHRLACSVVLLDPLTFTHIIELSVRYSAICELWFCCAVRATSNASSAVAPPEASSSFLFPV